MTKRDSKERIHFGLKPVLSRKQAQANDRAACQKEGVPSYLLMEHAGRSAADHLLNSLERFLKSPVIVVGPGQNGGDGFVLARRLVARGVSPTLIDLTPSRPKPPNTRIVALDQAPVGGDASIASALWERIGKAIPWTEREDSLERATLLIDAVFGTGLERPIKGLFADAITEMNASPAPTIALDLPSGICADTGAIRGVATKAVQTLTFAAPKRGLYAGHGIDYAGEIVECDIGVRLQDIQHHSTWVITDAQNSHRRPQVFHKGKAGRVLLFAGSRGKSGAALLAARGAFRTGAGVVTIASDSKTLESLEEKTMEEMLLRVESEQDLDRLWDQFDAAAVGPGFGMEKSGLIEHLLLHCPLPLVVDADALRVTADLGLERLTEAPTTRLLTPHPGEAGALLGVDSNQVQKDRFESVQTIAKRTSQIALLKGARTLLSDGEETRVIARGTPAMSVAGSGDVLTGIATALFAEDGCTLAKATLAAYLHAVAGEIASHGRDRGILSSEIADAVPDAWNQISSDAK